MKAYGKRKIRTPLSGHQDCGICHSDNKISAARERQAARREIEREVSPMLRETFCCCEICDT